MTKALLGAVPIPLKGLRGSKARIGLNHLRVQLDGAEGGCFSTGNGD